MYAKYGKRCLDFIIAFAAVCVLSPLLLLLAAAGAIEMKGNPFFVQVRPGKKERLFHLVKFRTMTCERDKNGDFLPDEKRLTKYGQFLRSTSLDELPELVNILKGDMSIVGPRPQLVKDMVFMTAEQRKRHEVFPGLTGLAQINGRNSITWEQKIEYDLQYINSITFKEDVRIVLRTMGKVLHREDINAQGMDTAEDLGDYLLRKGDISQEDYAKAQILAKEILRG